MPRLPIKNLPIMLHDVRNRTKNHELPESAFLMLVFGPFSPSVGEEALRMRVWSVAK